MNMHDVVVYLSSLQKQTPSRKTETLLAFATGAQSVGARVHVETEYVYTPSRLAVMLGWPSPEQKTPNIKLRAQVVEQQHSRGQHVMCIDSNCFKFVDHNSQYLRYSIGGPFYDTGNYANSNSDSSRWNQLSQDLGVEIHPWKTSGNYILLLIQRDGGWGMKGLDPVTWAGNKIKEIRKYTDMPILLRPHPGKAADVSLLIQPGITVSDVKNQSLMKDLKHAKAAFVYNSSSGVAAVLTGTPLWVDDHSSVCWAVANHDVGQLHNPSMPDRTQWLNDLSACHWTDAQSQQGLIYKKFLPYLS
jgi:hypothetical protein